MNKGLRISLSIFIPIILNFIFIIIVITRVDQCEYIVDHHKYLIEDIMLYGIWSILQIIAVVIILIKSKNRKPLIGLPIVVFLHIMWYSYWSTDLIDYKPPEFNRTQWNKEFRHYRINCVEDLIANEKLEGKCYDDIIEMLGDPDKENDKELTYDVGIGEMIIYIDNNCFESVEVDCK